MIRIVLSFLFDSLTKFRAYLYDSGILKSYKVQAKVISVGNISLGGAGKTPMVIWLSEKLKSKGLRIGIVEKGYKSKLSKDDIVLAQKGVDSLDTAIIGDEPSMVWNKISDKTRVVVSYDKTDGAFALKNKWPDTDVIIVDDGFQHLKLKRDFDIVLIDVAAGLEDKVFPKGRLRESYESLKRADVILFTKADGLSIEQKGELKQKVLEINHIAKVFFSNTNFITSRPIKDKKVFPVSAIYNPKHFHMKIKESGALFERYMAFADHYKFTQDHVDEIMGVAQAVGAESIVLTSKDWVKIKPFLGDNNSKVIEAWYEHEVENEEGFITCCIGR